MNLTLLYRSNEAIDHCVITKYVDITGEEVSSFSCDDERICDSVPSVAQGITRVRLLPFDFVERRFLGR